MPVKTIIETICIPPTCLGHDMKTIIIKELRKRNEGKVHSTLGFVDKVTQIIDVIDVKWWDNVYCTVKYEVDSKLPTDLSGFYPISFISENGVFIDAGFCHVLVTGGSLHNTLAKFVFNDCNCVVGIEDFTQFTIRKYKFKQTGMSYIYAAIANHVCD